MKTNLIKKITAGVMAAAIVVGSMFVGGTEAQAASKKAKYPAQYCTMTKAVRTAPNRVEIYVKQLGKKSVVSKLKNTPISVEYGKSQDDRFVCRTSFKKVSAKTYKAVLKDERLEDYKNISVTFDDTDVYLHYVDKYSVKVKVAKGLKWKKVCTKKAETYDDYKEVYNAKTGEYDLIPCKTTSPAEYEYRWVKVKK